MKITPINTNTYSPLSFKAETTSIPTGTYTTTPINNNTDKFEKSTNSTQPNTVNKVITSFKKLFTNESVGKSKHLSDKEISDLIFSRNMLL